VTSRIRIAALLAASIAEIVLSISDEVDGFEDGWRRRR
jgi:hypothetical protein